jgi:hypothetical protein
MAVTEYLKKNKWRYYLKGRKRDFKLFPVPSANVEACQVEMNTKRNVRINLSNGEKLAGFMTITSGTELYFPKRFRTTLKTAKWFECEIVGNKTYYEVTLDWV